MNHRFHLVLFFTSGLLMHNQPLFSFSFLFPFPHVSPVCLSLSMWCMHVHLCVCLHVHMEARGWAGVSSSIALTHSVLSQALTESGAHGLARLPGKQTAGVLLSPHPQWWDYTSVPPRWVLTWVLGIKTQVPGCRQSVWVLAAAPKYSETYSLWILNAQ